MPLSSKLLLNHLDAWGIAFIIAALALINHDAVNWQTTLLLLAITGGYWLAFVINDYFDAPFDAHHQEKGSGNFFVQAPGVGLSRAALLLIVLPVIGLILFAFLQFGRRGLFMLVICLVVIWGYSAPPLRLKNRPGLDLLAHGLFVETFAYFVCLFLIQASWNRLDYVILLLAFLSSTAAQLEQQLRDFEVDRRTGHTFTTVVGKEKTTLLLKLITLLILLIAFLGIGGGIIPPYLWPIAVIAMPTLIGRLRGRRRPFGVRRTGLVTLLLALGYTAVIYIIPVFSGQ
jgi:lycopene elongase/hydratase (dihydrobisanhydrobacterioruberin-forming)